MHFHARIVYKQQINALGLSNKFVDDMPLLTSWRFPRYCAGVEVIYLRRISIKMLTNINSSGFLTLISIKSIAKTSIIEHLIDQ